MEKGGQEVHCDMPVVSASVALGHDRQDEFPGISLYCPVGHGRHGTVLLPVYPGMQLVVCLCVYFRECVFDSCSLDIYIYIYIYIYKFEY